MTDPMQGQQGQWSDPGPSMGGQGQGQPPVGAQGQASSPPAQPQGSDPGAMGGQQAPAPGPPQGPPTMPQPPQPLQDPIQAAIQAILAMPAAEAVSRVYKLAASAVKAREQSRLLVARMDATGYHALLSSAPELKYTSELMAARRELDSLAQERRRLGLEAVKARQSTTPASVARASTYEMQAAGASDAIEHVAAGVLMFLALPSLPKPQDSGQQQPQMPSETQTQDTTTQQPQPPGGPT